MRIFPLMEGKRADEMGHLETRLLVTHREKQHVFYSKDEFYSLYLHDTLDHIDLLFYHGELKVFPRTKCMRNDYHRPPNSNGEPVPF